MDKSMGKISSKLFYEAPLSNTQWLDIDKIHGEKFEFIPCCQFFMFFFSKRSEFRQKSNSIITKKLALHLNAQNEFEKAPCLATPPPQ